MELLPAVKTSNGRPFKTLGPFIPRPSRRPSMKLDPSAFVADSELIQALEKQSSVIVCGRDLILFRQGDVPEGLYILDKGEATLIMRDSAGGEVMSINEIGRAAG